MGLRAVFDRDPNYPDLLLMIQNVMVKRLAESTATLDSENDHLGLSLFQRVLSGQSTRLSEQNELLPCIISTNTRTGKERADLKYNRL